MPKEPEHEKKLLYSRRYLDVSSEEFLEQFQPEDSPEPPESEPSTTFAMLLQKYEEESEYVKRPGGQKRANAFIRCVKALSERFTIDVDIVQDKGFVSADLYCSGPYFHDSMPMFSTLFSFSDSMDLTPTPNRLGYVTISLSCRTHDHYVSGRKLPY